MPTIVGAPGGCCRSSTEPIWSGLPSCYLDPSGDRLLTSTRRTRQLRGKWREENRWEEFVGPAVSDVELLLRSRRSQVQRLIRRRRRRNLHVALFLHSEPGDAERAR